MPRDPGQLGALGEVPVGPVRAASPVTSELVSPQKGHTQGSHFPEVYATKKRVPFPSEPCPHMALASGVPTSDKKVLGAYLYHDSWLQ